MIVNVAISLAAAAAAWWAVRTIIARRDERNFDAAYPRNSDGIIRGAEPIHLTGPRRGAVLLLHGYNDSPQSVASLAAVLHARGWSVEVPLLPGHGRTLHAFAQSGAAQWMNAARQELATLRSRHAQVAVGGLSMGGAIAFALAAEVSDVRAVVGLAPYLRISRGLRILEFVIPVAGLAVRYLSGGGRRSVHDVAASNAMIAYRRSTPRLLAQVDHVAREAFAALPRVRQPVLVVQSREDNRIPAASAIAAFQQVASADKTLHWVTGGGHVVTVDFGHTEVEAFVANWLESRLE